MSGEQIMGDLVQWLTAQLDADAMWAMEASRRFGQPAPEGGVHWQWETNNTDEVITPNPGNEEFVGGDNFRVSLRSRETWPTRSVRELPQFAIPMSEEVPSAVGGHIMRWDPARVLREIDAKRRVIAEVVPEIDGMEGRIDGEWGAGDLGERESMALLRLLALPYSDRPGFMEEWKP